MSDARFNLVFNGELVAGASPDAVKQNLAKLFKLDPARVEAMFSGKPVVLKKDADQATAMKFRAVLRQAGAQVRMEPVGAVEEVSAAPAPPVEQVAQEPAAPVTAPAPAQPAAAPATASAAAGDMDMVGTIRTGGTGFSGEFDVAPPGTDMADKADGPAPVVPDVSGISLAPAGSDMGQLKQKVEEKVPDISHLSIAPSE
jgi:hypothetical protein